MNIYLVMLIILECTCILRGEEYISTKYCFFPCLLWTWFAEKSGKNTLKNCKTYY